MNLPEINNRTMKCCPVVVPMEEGGTNESAKGPHQNTYQ
jgi:hypothetical protein